MTTYKELKEKFEKDVKKLQETCPHDDVSDWLDEYYAPGHSSGFQVKVCNICNKIVARRGHQNSNYIKGPKV